MVAKKDSPALSARASKASDADEPAAKPARQTASPKVKRELTDLEPVRFSRRQDLEKHDSPIGKIIIYIVVVVVVGVGLTLLVQNYITNQNANSSNNTADTPQAEPDVVIPNATIASTLAADSTASNINSNDAFTISDLSLGSAGNDVSNVNISKLKHEVFSTFTRTSWTLEGLQSGLPATKISYNSLTNTVIVVFNGVTNVDAGFLQDIKAKIGNVTDITGTKDSAGISFALKLAAPSKYFAFITSGNVVSLDIKTEQQLSQPNTPSPVPTPAPTPTPTPSPTPTPVPTPSSSTGAPAAPHYDNTASQLKQYVASAVTTNSITFASSRFDASLPGFYEYSFAMQGTDETSIPNASAELKQDTDESYYVEVKINNLNYDIISAKGKTSATLDSSAASSNIKEIDLISYTNGTSTYWVRLKHKADFRLRATETADGAYRLLGIQVGN